MKTILNFINMIVNGVQQFFRFFIDLPDTISQFLGGYIPSEIIGTLLVIFVIVVAIRVLELLP